MRSQGYETYATQADLEGIEYNNRQTQHVLGSAYFFHVLDPKSCRTAAAFSCQAPGVSRAQNMFMESRSQVPANQRRAQRRPKRRSSCDACGAAKLRCDRGQPSCERCINQGLQCVYGICRKMGKPPHRNVNHHSTGEDRGSNNSPTSHRRAGSHDMNGTMGVTLPQSMDSFISNDIASQV